MKVGEMAPDFTLPDGDGNEWRLADQRGQTVTLLFYPGDDTPVCTKQMCSVRDNWDEYLETDSVVVGISTDGVESHREFAGKYDLPFPLLADPKADVVAKYGVKSWIPGKSARAVVVVGKDGKIAYHDVQSLGIFRPDDADVIDAINAANARE